MKTLYLYLFIIILSLNQGFCDEPTNEPQLKSEINNPGILLNFQDVPIFHNGSNPLQGLNAFAVALFINNQELQVKLSKLLETELKSLGDVIHLNVMDMRGFGTGNVLMILIKNVSDWQEQETAISRVCLQIQTPITINKTDIKTFPIVWSINSFFQGSIDQKSEEQILKATQTLLKQFVQNYKYANQSQRQKSVFYMYD